jgi:hypothetical protein
MLGRHESERFFPVEYQTFVGRIAFYSSRGLLSEIERVSRDLPVVNALILGALHEARISAQGLKHDGVNLGAEVQCSTKALLDLVNNGASRRFEATPSF